MKRDRPWIMSTPSNRAHHELRTRWQEDLLYDDSGSLYNVHALLWAYLQGEKTSQKALACSAYGSRMLLSISCSLCTIPQGREDGCLDRCIGYRLRARSTLLLNTTLLARVPVYASVTAPGYQRYQDGFGTISEWSRDLGRISKWRKPWIAILLAFDGGLKSCMTKVSHLMVAQQT